MNNIYNTISDMDIPNGSTKRMDCPNCGGYKTFTVTNNMGSLVWNCYKASCTLKGGTRVHLSVDDIRSGFSGAEKFAEEAFELPSYIVPHRKTNDVLQFCCSYQLDPNELGVLYDVKEDRVVFPISHNGKLVDATGRALGKRLPKWKRYGKSGLPFSHGCGKVAVVVEDCVSAAVVGGKSFVGVAILGTSLQESHKGYLTQFSTAVIALDPDALPKTMVMAKELRGHVNDVRVLRLKDDLKYRNPEDMEKLNGIITN
jgi:hypothetical protein|tara:strand:- start:7110 stop:7880 length:771 start_codon:yes stop_codon:yes gene_type:complete